MLETSPSTPSFSPSSESTSGLNWRATKEDQSEVPAELNWQRVLWLGVNKCVERSRHNHGGGLQGIQHLSLAHAAPHTPRSESESNDERRKSSQVQPWESGLTDWHLDDDEDTPAPKRQMTLRPRGKKGPSKEQVFAIPVGKVVAQGKGWITIDNREYNRHYCCGHRVVIELTQWQEWRSEQQLLVPVKGIWQYSGNGQTSLSVWWLSWLCTNREAAVHGVEVGGRGGHQTGRGGHVEGCGGRVEGRSGRVEGRGGHAYNFAHRIFKCDWHFIPRYDAPAGGPDIDLENSILSGFIGGQATNNANVSQATLNTLLGLYAYAQPTYNLSNSTLYNRAAEFNTDYSFLAPQRLFLKAVSAEGRNQSVWAYSFQQHLPSAPDFLGGECSFSPRSAPALIIYLPSAAFHTNDLYYLDMGLTPVPSQKLVYQMQDFYISFTSDLNPGASWPHYVEESKIVMRLLDGSVGPIEDTVRRNQTDFLNQVALMEEFGRFG
ncbi:hypothetical protein B0H11DRAFT_1900024 [Mycena galericulata]|nr:hypothetical protein B0H11DRAFT_1900024 [Mycena galericulata]